MMIINIKMMIIKIKMIIITIKMMIINIKMIIITKVELSKKLQDYLRIFPKCPFMLSLYLNYISDVD